MFFFIKRFNHICPIGLFCFLLFYFTIHAISSISKAQYKIGTGSLPCMEEKAKRKTKRDGQYKELLTDSN